MGRTPRKTTKGGAGRGGAGRGGVSPQKKDKKKETEKKKAPPPKRKGALASAIKKMKKVNPNPKILLGSNTFKEYYFIAFN